MATPIRAEIQSLSPSAMIELFVLDMTGTYSGGFLYFHAGTNGLNQPITWQGRQYDPWPISAKGFDMTTQGTLPQPQITIANIGGVLSGEVQANDDLVGCKITRKRTLAKYLDAVNFPGGTNPDADPNQYLPDEMWYVEQKTSETRHTIEFKLSSVFDLMGIQLPYRQVIQNSCPWKYRGSECGYTGPYFDRFDQPTSNSNDDACAKLLSSCKVRQQYFSSQILPFGGFPGATRYAKYS